MNKMRLTRNSAAITLKRRDSNTIESGLLSSLPAVDVIWLNILQINQLERNLYFDMSQPQLSK